MANQPSKESLAQLLSYASDSSDGSHLSTPVRDGLGAFVRYGEEANDHAVHQEPTEKPVSPNTASLDNSQPSSPPRDATLPPLTSPEPSAAPLTQRQQLLCPPAIPDVEEWGIPSEPPGAADPDVQARFNQWQAMMADGADFNTQLFGNKSFRNPHLCAKFIEFLELDEFGSNFSTTVFDPHALSRAQYLEDMAQANHHKAAADRTRTTIDFVTSRRSNAKEHSATRSGSTEKARARLAANSLTSVADQPPQSKWDQSAPSKRLKQDQGRRSRS